MKTEVTANKVVYSVSASIEWSMKIFRCLDLMPECHLEGKLIPNGELQNDCHEGIVFLINFTYLQCSTVG